MVDLGAKAGYYSQLAADGWQSLSGENILTALPCRRCVLLYVVVSVLQFVVRLHPPCYCRLDTVHVSRKQPQKTFGSFVPPTAFQSISRPFYHSAALPVVVAFPHACSIANNSTRNVNKCRPYGAGHKGVERVHLELETTALSMYTESFHAYPYHFFVPSTPYLHYIPQTISKLKRQQQQL